ncbi:hypothetical protein [Rhizobium sp. BR 315]|uniref:hypothetical protein n=1 Tax=Rhizobium sp. BR 315 TaxID=3040014 RepID=UPI003D3463F2
MTSEWKRDEPVVQLSIVTEHEFSDWIYGRRFFEMLIEADPRLTPETIGNSDNLEKYQAIDSFKPHWGKRVQLEGPNGSYETLWGVPWDRKAALRNSGHIDFTGRSKKGNLIPGRISLLAAYNEATNWLSFFKGICSLTKAAAGFFHVPAEVEKRLNAPGYSPYYPGVGGTLLNKQLSNIAWATFFGAPFAHEADFAELAKLGYHVEELAGGYLLLMSDDIMDCFNDFPTFSRRRVELKKHFRPDLFRITEEAQVP